MTQAIRFVAIAVLLTALDCDLAQADIYKCTDTDGSITYSQTPCPKQKTESLGSSGSGAAAIDCAHANRFAFTSARLMQGGVSSSDLFNRYGGVDALSKGSINLINYVYGFRTSGNVTAERIASLTQAKCKARSLGDVSCEALPLSYTESIGGCDATEEDLAAVEGTTSAAALNSAPVTGSSNAAAETRAERAAADQRREAQRESCKDRYRDKIDEIDAEMRRGYSSQQGEVYREQLRRLTQQMRKC